MTRQPLYRIRAESPRDVLRPVVRGWPWVLGVALLFGAGAWGLSALQTPQYASTAVLYVTSTAGDDTSTAYQGSLASQQRVASYSRLVSSDAVLSAGINNAGLGSSSIAAARDDIRAFATPDTVLLNVVATSSDRAFAARLANGVAQAMTSYVSRLETPASGGTPLAKLTLVTPASVSDQAVSPKTARNVLLGLAIGLVVGLAGVLARARLSNRIIGEDDLTGVSELPVLASVPTDSELTKRGLLDFSKGGAPAAEAFRKLRTSLTFANVDQPPRVLLVSSAVAVEGKTTTAMNLAAALVESGERVVLVDADLRRPQVNARTGLVGEFGLTNFLRGDGALNDLVQPTRIEGLWILASGPKPPNPAELLGSKRASEALAQLAVSFNYVIVDSPPVLPVTDAVVLSQCVDGVLLVARSNSTKVPDLVDAFAQISGGQTPVVGFVLTDAPIAQNRYGYYGVGSRSKAPFRRRRRDPKAIEDVLEPKSKR